MHLAPEPNLKPYRPICRVLCNAAWNLFPRRGFVLKSLGNKGWRSLTGLGGLPRIAALFQAGKPPACVFRTRF